MWLILAPAFWTRDYEASSLTKNSVSILTAKVLAVKVEIYHNMALGVVKSDIRVYSRISLPSVNAQPNAHVKRSSSGLGRRWLAAI